MADFDYDPNNDDELEDLEDETVEDEEDQLDEEELDEEQQAEEHANKRKDANRLKKIIKTAPYRFYPYLTSSEKKLVQRLRKSGHALEVARLNQVMAQRKQAFWAKVKSVVAPAVPFIGIFALIIFIIIAVIVIVATIFPWLFPEDENGGSKGMASPFGIKGDMFYGARAVYRDETLSRNGLIEQYVDIIETSVDNLQSETYTEIIEVEGENKTFDVKVTVNLEVLKLPDEDFDYENLDLTQFQSKYARLYEIVGDIAKVAYKVDNGADAPADLIETLDGIKYFGFNAEMIGSSIVDTDKEVDNNIIEIVYDALTESGVITIQEKLNGSTGEFTDATNATLESLDEEIRAELISTINVDKNKVRTEKLFIKDFILEDAESYMEGIEKKNYVALIYMPKESVEFNYVSYMINIDKTAEFSMVLTNNGNEILLTKGEGENWSDNDDATELTYTFKSAENLNQTANVTDIVDAANLNKFTSGSSLVKVLTTASNHNLYLEETTDENDEKVLTYKKGSMFISFESDQPFMFNDEMTYVK